MRLVEIVMFGVGLVVTITGVAFPMIIPRERRRGFGVGLLVLGLAILLLTAQTAMFDGTPTSIASWEFWKLFGLVVTEAILIVRVLRDLVRRCGASHTESFHGGPSDSEPSTITVERPLFLMGFCWKIQPRFFEIYRRSHFPEAATLEESVLGPLCVRCGRLRVFRTEHDYIEP